MIFHDRVFLNDYRQSRYLNPLMFLGVRAAASTAFAAVSSRLSGELPVNSAILATDIGTFSWVSFISVRVLT